LGPVQVQSLTSQVERRGRDLEKAQDKLKKLAGERDDAKRAVQAERSRLREAHEQVCVRPFTLLLQGTI
jgi:hypothetical protein